MRLGGKWTATALLAAALASCGPAARTATKGASQSADDIAKGLKQTGTVITPATADSGAIRIEGEAGSGSLVEKIGQEAVQRGVEAGVGHVVSSDDPGERPGAPQPGPAW